MNNLSKLILAAVVIVAGVLLYGHRHHEGCSGPAFVPACATPVEVKPEEPAVVPAPTVQPDEAQPVSPPVADPAPLPAPKPKAAKRHKRKVVVHRAERSAPKAQPKAPAWHHVVVKTPPQPEAEPPHCFFIFCNREGSQS